MAAGGRALLIRTDGDSVDHDRDLGNAPAHDEGTDTKVLLERGTEQDETTDVERRGDVTCPVWHCHRFEVRLVSDELVRVRTTDGPRQRKHRCCDGLRSSSSSR